MSKASTTLGVGRCVAAGACSGRGQVPLQQTWQQLELSQHCAGHQCVCVCMRMLVCVRERACTYQLHAYMYCICMLLAGTPDSLPGRVTLGVALARVWAPPCAYLCAWCTPLSDAHLYLVHASV